MKEKIRGLTADEITGISVVIHTIYGDFEIQTCGKIKECTFEQNIENMDVIGSKYFLKIPTKVCFNLSSATDKGYKYIFSSGFWEKFKNILDKESQERYNKGVE